MKSVRKESSYPALGTVSDAELKVYLADPKDDVDDVTFRNMRYPDHVISRMCSLATWTHVRTYVHDLH